jgi:hypothetical protein
MRFFLPILFLVALKTNAQSPEKSYKTIQDIALMEQQGHQRIVARENATLASNNFDVKYYRCEWEVDPAIRYIKGNVTIYYVITAAADFIILDLMDPLVADSVKQNNAKLTKSQSNNTLTINFPGIVNPGTLDSVSIYYRGVPPNTGFGSFVQSTHAGIPVMWSLSEPYGSRDWWPCKNGLDDKADSIEVKITHPVGYKAASNGILQGETISAGGTKITAHWKHRYAIASYLICFAVTNYSVFNNTVQLSTGILPMQTYCYPESLSSFQTGTGNTLNAMQLYDTTFGPYPFMNEKYGHVQFGWGGGMEHQTSTFVTNIGESLCAHELGHQWFGDKITCGTWKDIWLNEGFATYLASLYMEKKYPANTISTRISEINTITSQPGGSVEVDDTTSVNRIFDSRLSYTKGSHLLYMLRWKLGDTVFFNALRNYQTDPAVIYGFARTADLKRNLEQTSGQNLTNFFNQWYSGQGYPTYNIQWANTGSGSVWIKMNQVTSHTSVSFFDLPVALQFKNATQSATVVVNNTSNGEIFIKPLGFVADAVIIDPDAWLISRNNTSTKLPTCGTVSGLTASAITASSATLSWSAAGGANSYYVDYKSATSSVWINAATAITSLSFNLSGLTAGSLYNWRVKANCTAPAGVFTEAQFSTAALPVCGTVTGLSATAISSFTATLSWFAINGANNYTVDYKLAASTTWINAVSATTSLSVNLSGLTSGSLYDWRVRANCTGATGTYATAQFTTLPQTCPGPYDISTNGTAAGAALIPLNTDIKGRISPVNDIDFYRFRISTPGTITLTLKTLPANYNLDLQNASGTRIGRSGNKNTNDESISMTVASGDYYAKVYPSGSANNAALCYTLSVEAATGKGGQFVKAGIDGIHMHIYPNPADQFINISIAGYNLQKTIEVFDQNGNLVIAEKTLQHSISMGVSKLAAGLYLIKIISDSGTILCQDKFIKE